MKSFRSITPLLWVRLLRCFRKIALCAGWLFFFSALFAQIQPAAHVSLFKKLSVIKTQYFDIIFPVQSEKSARHLALHADTLYEKLCDALLLDTHSLFGKTRCPVLITPEYDVLNAYFTVVPYNRIVLRDCVPSSSFAVFSDTLVSVFYHELVHAVTLNIKSPFWHGTSAVFGDWVSPSLLLNFPTSFVEGAAVSFESVDGEGRLNDNYSLHVLRQAKIEDKFPDWRDVAGSYSLYTDGSLPYMFGASFSSFIQKKYGMRSYADFWKNGGTFYPFKLSAGIFKKTYGISLTQAWNDFKQTLVKPAVAEHGVNPLFAQKSSEYRESKKGKHLYTCLTASSSAIAWYDAASFSVFTAQTVKDGRSGKNGNIKKRFLYTSDLHERLSFSRDGKFLVSSGASGGSKAVHTVRVYDCERGSFVASFKHIRDGAIVTAAGGKQLLAGIETDGAQSSLVLYDWEYIAHTERRRTVHKDGRHSTHGGGTPLLPLVRIPFEANSLVFEPTDAGNGRIVCIVRSGVHTCLFIYDTANGTSAYYRVQKAIQTGGQSSAGQADFDLSLYDAQPVLSSLSVQNGKLYVSCALTPYTQPVLAWLDTSCLHTSDTVLEQGTGAVLLHVQDTQFSGGVFCPVPFAGGIAFISRFYEHRSLSFFEPHSADMNSSYALQLFPADNKIRPEHKQAAFTDRTAFTTGFTANFTAEYVPYHPLHYMKKGMIIPLAGSLNMDALKPYVSDIMPLGFSAATSDPAERFVLSCGAGFNVESKNAALSLSASCSEKAFTFAADAYAETKTDKIQNISTRLHTGFRIPVVSDFNSLYIQNNTFALYRLNGDTQVRAGYTLLDEAKLGFVRTQKTGIGYYDVLSAGVSFVLHMHKNWSAEGVSFMPAVFYNAFETSFHFPFLIPFKNPRNFTLNLPFSLVARYYINARTNVHIGATAVLFSCDIQKPLPFAPIFFRRLTFDGGAECKWLDAYERTQLSVHSSLFTTFTFNSGSAVTFPIDMGAAVLWSPEQKDMHGFSVRFKFSVKR